MFSGGLAIACSGLARRAQAFTSSGEIASLRSPGFGELVPTATRNTGETFLALPRGFEYNVIGKAGGQMSDGRITPTRHDGMWTFKVGNELRIVRNHEVTGGRIPRPGSAIGTNNHYDETAGGGTTTLIVDQKTGLIKRDFVSLSGTLVNCSGGPTPWGSWITCEETSVGPQVRTLQNGTKIGGFPKPHGYCFEVPASANSAVPAVPLKAMGRFEHETIAVDRRTGIVYMTEDFNPCGFYRYIPTKKKRLVEGGTLQMLVIKGKPGYDTRSGPKQGTSFLAEWVTIDDPDPRSVDVDPSAVFKQGKAKGGATFARLEGSCADRNGDIYFDSTSGGDKKGGQIWRYSDDGRNGGQLTLLFESPDRDLLDMPDNLCVRPKSRQLFICEDSDYPGDDGKPENFIRILGPDGRIADFAKNVSNLPATEFAGSTFSPDGKLFFVNLQVVGATFAIWGDWDRFKQ